MRFMSELVDMLIEHIELGRDGVIDLVPATAYTHREPLQLALRPRGGEQMQTATVLRMGEHARVNLPWLHLPPPTVLCTKIVSDERGGRDFIVGLERL